MFFIKIDLTKAYDKLQWEFIWKVMNEIGVPKNMVNVIMHAISSVETNVNWHGVRGEFFRPRHGIIQGDPISPYLFVLCMDKLSHLIEEEVRDDNWNVIRMGQNGSNISHHMFTDDLLLFGEALKKQISYVMNTLKKFCDMSGQKVSKEKSNNLFSNNVTKSMRAKLIHMSNFKETNQCGKYLRVPLSGKALRISDYQYLLEQVESLLANWKSNVLYFPDRVTLVKPVMEAVPTYVVMINKIHVACIDELQRLQQNFIWGDTAEKKRFHAVKWETILKPKASGGLGLRNLKVMNSACLMKIRWKLLSDSDDLWCKVLKGIYMDLGSRTVTKPVGRIRAYGELCITQFSTFWKLVFGV